MSDTNKKIVWHVFADGYDSFVLTKREAVKTYRKLDKKEYPNARVYIEKQDADGETISEDHRWGRGEFPC